MGTYRVLEKDPISNQWIDKGWQEAGGQTQAIKKVANSSEGTFAAVPKTSWHPVKIAKRTEERWTVEDGGDDDNPVEPADEGVPQEEDIPDA